MRNAEFGMRNERDLEGYTGLGQFGDAYEVMLGNDCHADGSVDRVLQERMIRLCSDSNDHLYCGYTPTGSAYAPGSRTVLEACLEELCDTDSASDSEKVVRIVRFCSDLAEEADDVGLDSLVLGGTEEEIIERRTDWCTDLARVACALLQVAGIPSRVVYLANTVVAYSGHAVVEAYRHGRWGTVDPTAGLVYELRDGAPVATWNLMQDPALFEAHSGSYYSVPDQYRAAAVSNYLVGDYGKYDYTTSRINDYYRSILEMSEAGWPGGLRWMHGEDKSDREIG